MTWVTVPFPAPLLKWLPFRWEGALLFPPVLLKTLLIDRGNCSETLCLFFQKEKKKKKGKSVLLPQPPETFNFGFLPFRLLFAQMNTQAGWKGPKENRALSRPAFGSSHQSSRVPSSWTLSGPAWHGFHRLVNLVPVGLPGGRELK